MRMKKANIWLLILLFLLIIIFIHKNSEHQQSYTDKKAEHQQSYMNDYNTHIFLEYMGKGDCYSLTGDVLITVVLVDDLDSQWTEEDIADFKNVQRYTTNNLTDEAQSQGVELNVELNYIHCQIDDTFDKENFGGWISNALKAADLPTEGKVIPTLKDRYSVKEAPLLFAVNRKGRSFAMPCKVTEGFEYAILYREHGDYRHELFHLFGAKDFYYPNDVKTIAEQYFSNSIMMTSGDVVIDSLTAYLMGWQESMSEEAKKFIDETAWITQEYMSEAYEETTITGQGTIRFGDGTYTGELVDGFPHGKGRIVWDDGNIYEGEWSNGVANGYGTMIWNTHGVSYTGYWENWNMHGQGTYTYANGTTLTGRWENNEFKE